MARGPQGKEPKLKGMSETYDVAIVGGGIAGVVALAAARRAGLEAIVLERQDRIGGLWRDLPAWQDIQISALDWTLGDLPIDGTTQPHILANIEAWVEQFDLADGIWVDTPVECARHAGTMWELDTPRGTVHSRHLIAATGAHNTPVIPALERTSSTVREFHSSALHGPQELVGRDVLVVGGGASAFDLLDLCFEHGARNITWAYRGLRWFLPTSKPKYVDGHRFDADFLLWGTGYSVDLSYFDAERSRASRPLTRLRRAVVVSSAAWTPLISTSLASA